MPKNVASLKTIVREIAKTQKKLEKAQKSADDRGKKELALSIKRLDGVKAELKQICRNSFNIVVP